MAKTTGIISLVRGEDREVSISFRKNASAPLDLTGVTAITATFSFKSQGIGSVTLEGGKIEVVSPPGAGMINLILDSSFTTQLSDGDRQDFQIDIVIAGKKTIFRFEESLAVAESMSS